jgi:succinate dehydrogenase / fumarate reductase cytochrome b subunit
MDRNKPAPKFLNLLQIKLPVGGVTSIAHRISGVLMFLAIPLVAWMFAQSLQSAASFEAMRASLQSLPLRVGSLLLVWALSHHLLAGIRHLFLDIDIGARKPQARSTAWLVNLGALGLTLLYLGCLL